MSYRYIAIGDSLSEGVGDLPWPDGTPRGWTDRLAGLLTVHHGPVEYANLAVRGYKTDQIRDHQLDQALSFAPDLVTITAGMNDILRPRVDFDALQVSLAGLVAAFRKSDTTVMFVPIPDLTGVSPAGSVIDSRRRRLNTIYQQLADQMGVVPLASTDGTVFEDPRAWAADRLHLSELGHERLALGAADALGLAEASHWNTALEGARPSRSLRTEAQWWWFYVLPWVNRRVRGRSSGDGRTAKLPTLSVVESMETRWASTTDRQT
ncbi:SGNH/GDSL hydrolase family protein [Arthrobacter sp. SX1312]|uniref:SGNH/GDSL hydrolase family protein n=1 Tax=Arthrobacter sp. SX1312 TaxID=2058896 RepID=UPI000CE3F33F|nr:SGNH/GDSL hydrolase family protein [Arthrobacter sp. SX1312]